MADAQFHLLFLELHGFPQRSGRYYSVAKPLGKISPLLDCCFIASYALEGKLIHIMILLLTDNIF